MLVERGIQFLIDIRSRPYSGRHPQYAREALAAALRRHGIRYVFLGDLLGGLPQDAECYDEEHKVDYAQLEKSERFIRGIARLRSAWQKGLRVCLMCSESRPEECHRSKLIGEVLDAEGIPVRHIGADGVDHRQMEIRQLLLDADGSLFGPGFFRFTSRKRYS